MSGPIRVRRKNALNVLREAEKLMSFDEFPLLRPEVDPQLHASRNTVDQPFYLSCEKDCVIAQLSGRSQIHFPAGNVRWFDLGPGDFVYVPGGNAHRLLTKQPGVMIRYKARQPGNEIVFWLCEGCGQELFRYVCDTSTAVVQLGYQTAVESFNAEESARTCRSCGRAHQPIDLSAFRWRAVAEALAAAEDD